MDDSVQAAPSGTVTFLFTDIEGSTKRWEKHPEIMRAASARHDSLLRNAIAARGGFVFKTIGDAFCAAFPNPLDALQAAMAAQRALAEEQWAPEIGSLKVRMALHTGVADAREGDYLGLPTNRVARILSTGHGGQVLVSEVVQSLVRDTLPEQVALRDLGEHRLKDLTRPEHIFQLQAPGLPAEFPALRTLDVQPNNLPLQPTMFIGREKEIEAVCSLLRGAGTTLVTLTGPGGTGKTRLALQVAADLLDEFADGAYFVSLAPITDPGLVMSSIAQALGVREAGGQPVAETLKRHLAGKRMLLVLDNFEHLAPAAALLPDLLAAAPWVKLLVTSRQVLHLRAEHEYLVLPLSLPPLRDTPKGSAEPSMPLEQLTQYEAVRLFIERATTAKSDFQITNDNAPAVAEICVRLDGLPLAIELAAARTRLFSPQALLARLSSSLKLLTGGAVDLPARQQTLRHTIDWSYDLLDPADKQLFMRMAVFQGGGSLEAVEAVCGYGPSSAPDTDPLEGIASLVDKSLVLRGERPDGEPRFSMLETLHEYALEKLDESGEAEGLRGAHAGYFMGLAEEAEPNLKGANQVEWFERLESEHDNLRAALEWSLSGGEVETGGRIAGALFWFWLRRGHLSEGRRWLMQAAAAGGLPKRVRAKCLHGAGAMAYEQGDHAQARELLEEALALRRELGDKRDMAGTLNNLANVALFQDDYDLAARSYGEALALSRELGDQWSTAIVGGNSGWVEMNRGDYERAARFYDESLAIRRQLGDKWGIANSLNNLAWARTYQGDYERASELAAEGMEIFKEMGDKESISDLLDIQARVALGRGDYPQARALLKEELKMAQEMDNKSAIALGLMSSAAVLATEATRTEQPAANEKGQAEALERAAALFGAADALRESTAGFQWAYFGPHIASLRAALGNAGFEKAQAQGRQMTTDQAIAYAVEA